MARLDYVRESAGASEEAQLIFDEIIKLRGGVVNLYRILANQPPALRAFMSMSRYIREDSSLPPQLRELAILVTADVLNVEYERVHHRAAARTAGVSEQKLEAIGTWRTSDVYTPAERAAMAYADQATRSRAIDDATMSALLRHFSPQGVIDLAVTVAWYHFCAALIGPLGIELEDASRGGGSRS
ncbi:MAG TPA: carboxymuconolactone decarboxylase family protein [bacterium]|nr:carboxymuconolactone decarboxylase family protein [bacterium]